MQEMLEQLTKQNAELAEQNRELAEVNRVLTQKVQFLLKRLFGSKSEKLDRNQLELLLGALESAKPDPNDPPPSAPPHAHAVDVSTKRVCPRTYRPKRSSLSPRP